MNMKDFVTVIGAFGFLIIVSVQAKEDTIKTAALSQPLSTENIEALRAFKQLGFDDQHTSGRIRPSDIAVHHVYHDPNQGSGNYKPYLSSKYGSSSDHASSSFQQSAYLSGQEKKKNQGMGTSLGWSNSAMNEMSNNAYLHQVRSHPNDILSNMGVELPSEQILGEVPTLTAVQGSSVDLPCNITPPIFTDRVRLVLFFKNDSAVPIYTYDTRGQSHAEARHWSDENVLGGRAFFRGDQKPSRLVIDQVQGNDAGEYRCRADFYRAPTTISHMKLHVIVPPEKPKIYEERGQEVRLKLGPYKIGDTILLKCVASGGRPTPRVTWWRDHALLDDISEEIESDGSAARNTRVTNELRLNQLRRDDLHTILTCQASNNNISVPVSTSVKLDMHFGALDVRLLGRKEPVSAGRSYEFRCQSVGARPAPIITWWRGSIQLRENITNRTSPDGNVTLSTLNYVPSVRDAGKFMSCRAENPELPDATLEDGWKLQIYYSPQAVLNLGSSLNASNIKEGDDVYFECNVRANPKPYKITWKFNGKILLPNAARGVLISNQSLVLQHVYKEMSGVYTCMAHNIEGDGTSNPMTLNIRYAPYCKPDQTQVFGVAREETVRISCSVLANPAAQTRFEWRFNASGIGGGHGGGPVMSHSGASNVVDMPHDRFRSPNQNPTTSIVEYVPRTEMDYGSLLCWASNPVGRQIKPCVFHLIPAGVPDPLRNCSIGNQTTSSMQVNCAKGYDGGLPQTFILEAKDNKNFVIVSQIQSPLPRFNVSGLQPGSSYILNVYAQNSKGASSPVTLYAFTIKEAEKQMAGSTHRRNLLRDGVTITPVLGVLVAIACGLSLVVVAIIVVLRIRPALSRSNRREGSLGGGRPGSGRSGNLNNHSHYLATHVHLPLSQSSCGENSGDGVDECINMEEKDPDVIPSNKELIDEEEAFQSYRQQHADNLSSEKRSRYSATLQRTSAGICGGNMSSPLSGESVCDDNRGKEHERLRGIKNNFSRLSQEVTYAEFTMPRNKGYAPMRARPGSDSPHRLPVCKEGSVYYSAVPQLNDKITEELDVNDDHSASSSINIASLKRKNPKLSKSKPRPPAPPPRYTSPPTTGSLENNDHENRLNNQSHHQRAINNLNNVLVNNNLNLNSSFGGTHNLNNAGSILICNNTPNNLVLASSSGSPTSSTSTLQDTSSLAPRDNRNRYGGFQNKIQNITLGEPNLTSQNHSLNMAETPLVSFQP